MQRPSPKVFGKIALSVPPTAVYLFLIYLVSHSAGHSAAIDVLRHIVLAAGLVPLFAWGIAIWKAEKSNAAKLVAAAIAITMVHWVVVAVSAHYDGLLYWSFQAFEFGLLIQMIRVALRSPAQNVA